MANFLYFLPPADEKLGEDKTNKKGKKALRKINWKAGRESTAKPLIVLECKLGGQRLTCNSERAGKKV
jgi:hypothetical protein